MIYNCPFLVIDERIPAVEECDAVHNVSHGGIVDFNSHHTDKGPVVIDWLVVGNDPHIQIVRDIGWKPDGPACSLWNSEPDKSGSVFGIILRDVGNLVLLEAFSVQIDIPESFFTLRNGRVNPIIICYDAVGLMRELLENVPCPSKVSPQTVRIQSVQIRFHISGNHFD